MLKVAFRTLGCRANQYDTQMMKEKLPEDWEVVLPRGKADVFCINTCTVTNSSDSKSRQYIRQILKKNPESKIIVTGCYAHTSPREVLNIKGVDLVFDNTEKTDIKHVIQHALQGGRGIIDGNGDSNSLTYERISFDAKHTRAFLKIQDGCRRRCSFCKTTYARGKSRNKPISLVLQEVNELVDNGYREVVFCGINLAEYRVDSCKSYNQPKAALVKLLEKCAKVDKLKRIRLSSLNLDGFNEDLLNFFRVEEKACPYFHVPLQSGDDKILKRMRRGYLTQDYKDMVKKIKDTLPDGTLGCDLMVGFPGEGPEEFRNTCQLVKESGFINTHLFRYSKRGGTEAARYEDQVPESKKKRRAKKLNKIAKKVEKNAKRKYIGETLEVLVEEESPLVNANWRGHSKNFLDVHFQDRKSYRPGETVKVEIKSLEDYHGYPLMGKVKPKTN